MHSLVCNVLFSVFSSSDVLLSVLSSSAIILTRKRELVAPLVLFS